MTQALLPIAFAIFVWWFSTGIVLLLDGLPRTTFRWSHLISSLLALGSLVGLIHTASQTTPAGAFCAFTCALLVWGWHELSFLTGWVTGTRKQPLGEGVTGWRRFTHAVQTILWHELGILASGLVILGITWGQPNQVGMATFAVLWFMRISAKLNIFLGVRNLSIELLPPHLKYLGSYFRRRAMNLLFPFVVSVATGVAVLIVNDALDAAPGSARAIGSWLVSTMLILGILEHWLLVLPLEATALWRWALNDTKGRPAPCKNTTKTVPALSTIESDEKLFHAR
jgi:putative photosynthetic complex assembly protein 2